MDAWWPRLAVAVLQTQLGPLTDELKTLAPISNDANSGGSSYGSGWYSYVDEAVRAALGSSRARRARRPRSRAATARRRRARRSSGQSLDQAGNALAAAQGPDPVDVALGRDRRAHPILGLPLRHDALDEPPDVPASDLLPQSSLVSGADDRQEVPLHPGADARAAGGARRPRRAGRPSPQPRLQADLRKLPDAAPRGLPHGARRAALHRLRHRRVRVGGGEPRLAGRVAPRRLGRQLRRALGRHDRRLRRRGRPPALRVGRDARSRRRARAAAASASRRRSGSSTPRRRPASSATSRRSPLSRRRQARSSSSTRCRASARCAARPTPGASTSSSPARRRH